MMAEPMAPGRGLRVYQPATVVVDGTWRPPPGATPSLIRRVRTPIAGMTSDTGRATAAGGIAAVSGGAARRPAGAGIVTGGPACTAPRPAWLTMIRPATPVPAASMPQ